MLPKRLVENVFSLKSARVSSALSVFIRLDSTGRIIDYGIHKSIVKPKYNLTYDEADDLIDYAPPQEKELALLSLLLSKRRQFRQSNGAIFLEQSQGRFIVNNEQIDLKIIDQSPSRRLVSECMILFGTVIADYAITNKLPVPYRCQGETHNSLSLNSFSSEISAVRNSFVKQNLLKATTNIYPKRHFSLGLDAYVQATSPLRRYSDLIVHRQIISELDNTSLYTESEVVEILREINRPQQQAIEIMREDQSSVLFNWFLSRRSVIWKTYYLRGLRLKEKLVLLYFETLEIEAAVNLIEVKDWEIGDRLDIRIHHIDNEHSKMIFKIY